MSINLFFFPGVGFIVRLNVVKDEVFDGSPSGLREARTYARDKAIQFKEKVSEDSSVKWALSNKSYIRKPTKSITIFAENESDGKIRLIAKDGTRVLMVQKGIILKNAPSEIEGMRNHYYRDKMLPKLDSSATRLIRVAKVGGLPFGPVRQDLRAYGQPNS